MNIGEFSNEIDVASAAAKSTIEKILASQGVSGKGLNHALNQPFYYRVPGLFSVWISDSTKRIKAAELMIIHCIGLKMIDDIVDNDHDIDHCELILGAHLMQYAILHMADMAGTAHMEVHRLFFESYHSIYGSICSNNGRSKIDSLDSWITTANIQGGEVFSCYGMAASLIENHNAKQGGINDFCKGFGRLVILLDDFADYVDLNEEDGNLAHLYKSGEISKAEILTILEDCWNLCKTSFETTEASHDLLPVTSSIYSRARESIEVLA